jgi:hypothetical protein
MTSGLEMDVEEFAGAGLYDPMRRAQTIAWPCCG